MSDIPQGSPLIPRLGQQQGRSTVGGYTEAASVTDDKQAERLHKDNELWHATTQSVLAYYKDKPDATDDKIIATLDRLYTWMTT